jgi:peptide/nickel transport system substrate-binding protein
VWPTLKLAPLRARPTRSPPRHPSAATRPSLVKRPPKTLILYYPNDPDTLNPITSNDSVSDEFFRLSYEYLAPRDFHDPDKFKPALAESWEFNPDKLEYTIKLRKGVKWHPMKLPNGKELPATEFTARDVKFTFDCILNKNVEAGHYRSYYEDSEAKDESERYKIKVSLVPGDKYTVKIKWTKPYFLMDEYTLNSTVIIPKHVFSVDENGEPISFDMSSSEFAKKFNNHWANTMACGTGPMMLKKWKKDEQLEFERNADYWGSPFYFSNAIYRCIPNTNTEMQQILQNQLDFGIIPEKDLWVQAKSHKSVQDGKAVLEKFYFPSYRYIGYNMKHPFLKDNNVRWALGHAIPVDDILQKVFHGLGVRVTGPFLYSSKSNDKSLEPLKHDLEKSRQLLDEAGWKDTNADGVRDKMIGGERVDAKFDLMIYADSPTYLIIAEQVKENCRKVGINASITPAKWGLMLQRLQKKEFDACMLGWFLNWEQDPFQIWHGSLADVPNTSNSIGYKNPEVDRLIEKLRGTLDKEEQTKICHQIHKLIYDEQPYTFLFAEQRTAGRDARLGDLEFFPLRPCMNPKEWTAGAARKLGQ